MCLALFSVLQWINSCGPDIRLEGRYYYCHPHFTDEEIKVKELIEGPGPV